MSTDTLILYASILAMLSASSERLVELIKGRIPALNGPLLDPVLEERRKWRVNLLALVCSMLTAFLAAGPIGATLGWEETDLSALIWNHLATLVGLGLFAAGGSSFWNSVLGYLLSTKSIKKADAARDQAEAVLAQARVLEATRGGMPPLGSATI